MHISRGRGVGGRCPKRREQRRVRGEAAPQLLGCRAQALPRGCSPCPEGARRPALRGLPQPPARPGTTRRGGTPPEVRARGRGAAPAAARPTSATGGGAGAPRRGGEGEGVPLPPATRSGPGHDLRLTSEMEMRDFYPRAGGEGVGEKSGTAKPFLVLFCSSFQ